MLAITIQEIIAHITFISFVLVTSSAIITILAGLKFYCYRRIGWLEVLVQAALITLCAVFDKLHPFWLVIIDILFIVNALYAIYDFIYAYLANKTRTYKVNDYLKNATSDYFFATNRKDRIVDASQSYADLVGLTIAELKRSKGFQTMLSELTIVKINGRDVTEEVALTFLFDYEKNAKYLKNYKFDIDVKEKNEIVTYRGLVQPIIFGKKVLGSNIYLSKDRLTIVNDLRESLKNAIIELEDDKAQMHALMSLTNQVVMYYDFHTQTYVATEALCEALGTDKKEYQLDEFFYMIHPDDMNYYREQGETINSVHPTRIKIRMAFGKEYYTVYDDSIYIGKESGLVSIIRLAQENVTNISKRTTASDNPQIVQKQYKDELDELIDTSPKATLEATLNSIAKIVGEDNE